MNTLIRGCLSAAPGTGARSAGATRRRTPLPACLVAAALMTVAPSLAAQTVPTITPCSAATASAEVFARHRDAAVRAAAAAASTAALAQREPARPTFGLEAETFGSAATQLNAVALWNLDLARSARLTTALAQASADAAESEQLLAHEHVAVEIEALFFELEAAQRRDDRLSEAAATLGDLADGLRALAERGEIGRIELLRANQVALRVDATRAAAQGERDARRAVLARIAPEACPVSAPVEVPAFAPWPAAEPDAVVGTTPLLALGEVSRVEAGRAARAGRPIVGVGGGVALALGRDATEPGALVRIELTPRGRGARERAEAEIDARLAELDALLAIEAARSELAQLWMNAATGVYAAANDWQAQLDAVDAQLEPLLTTGVIAGEVDLLDLIAALEATLDDRLAIIELLHTARLHELAARRALLGGTP